MISSVNLFSNEKGEINKFLSSYYQTDMGMTDSLRWEKEYPNPIEISDLIGIYVDNYETFNLHMIVSFDKDVFINITDKNANGIIKYLFERFPY